MLHCSLLSPVLIVFENYSFDSNITAECFYTIKETKKLFMKVLQYEILFFVIFLQAIKEPQHGFPLQLLTIKIRRRTLTEREYGTYTCYVAGDGSEHEARVLLSRELTMIFNILQ